MKKTYINPEMEIVKLKFQNQLLAGSLPKGGEYNGGGVGARPLDEFEGF